MTRRARVLFWLGIVVSVLVATIASARPGGGHSYSGGGSHGGGGSGGSGGGGALLIWAISNLARLCIEAPLIGVPLVIGIIIFFIVISRSTNEGGWSTASVGASAGYQPPRVSPRNELEKLRAKDPDFSVVLFEDFLYALFAEVHMARGRNQLQRMVPYVVQYARTPLMARTKGAVSDIVIGGFAYDSVVVDATNALVTVRFTANYTENAQAYFVEESWTVQRPEGAKSRPPARVRTLDCPNCGAALEAIQGSVCTYCKSNVEAERKDWMVMQVTELTREARPPMLTGTTAEQGTDSPTLFDSNVQPALAALLAKDPAVTTEKLEARVKAIFDTMQTAWSNREWQKARGLLSDALYQTQLYWMDAYAKQGLRNITKNTLISKIELVRVTSDHWFDAVTVRVHASGLDFTVDESGKTVGGSQTFRRAYTEYWTLIRGAGVRGAPRSDGNCPNCGAEAKINMAGQCEFCKARLTSGEFDWVLSRIEQDDSYAG